MKKILLALLLVFPFAGCAHQQGGYGGGGGGGYFADDCLYSYGCYDGTYGRGFYSYYTYGYTVAPRPARTRVAKAERRASPRVVTRSASARSSVSRSVPPRNSARSGGTARSAPAAAPSRPGGRR